MTEVNAVIRQQFVYVTCQLILFQIIELFLAGVWYTFEMLKLQWASYWG